MPPTMRSVVAQLSRGGRSIGSRRNFCSPPPGGNESNGAEWWYWFIRRGVAVTTGYALGAVVFRDTASEFEQDRLELWRETEKLYKRVAE